jgi:hypothetical protein
MRGDMRNSLSKVRVRSPCRRCHSGFPAVSCDGNNMPANMAMKAMTTSNSMSVSANEFVCRNEA